MSDRGVEHALNPTGRSIDDPTAALMRVWCRDNGCEEETTELIITDRFTCPVCGYPDLKDSPRSAMGGGSYEICPSCGFEFGVTDDDEGYTFESWRARWISMGMPWDSESIRPPPSGWNPQQQLDTLLGSGDSMPAT